MPTDGSASANLSFACGNKDESSPTIEREYRNFFANLAREAVRGFDSYLKPLHRPNRNYLGYDVDADTLAKLDQLANDPSSLSDLPSYELAQLNELAFWRYVAFEGYADLDPRSFPYLQQIGMTSCFMITGWSLKELENASIVEIGCGPLGMIEYLPGKRRVAFDPLNQHYSRLFALARSSTIDYVWDFDELLRTQAGSFDLAICYNVIDHTSNPKGLFDSYMSLIRPGGRFLFEVNTVREGFPRSPEHESMHPSPFTVEKACLWLDEYSSNYGKHLADRPSSENEFFFMAWGTRDR